MVPERSCLAIFLASILSVLTKLFLAGFGISAGLTTKVSHPKEMKALAGS
jgi:hypothetical protein